MADTDIIDELGLKLNRTRIPAESKSSIPADTGGAHDADADTLFDWLGSFWSAVYKDPDFIKTIQSSRAIKAAQLYLDMLENLKLHDRENAPVFHREIWHPVVIRKSQRNTGSKNMSRLTRLSSVDAEGNEVPRIQLGDQQSVVYPPCTVLELGSVKAEYSGMTVYPLAGESSDLKSVLTCIVNDISSATDMLSSGKDFAILDGAIAFSSQRDPFTGDNSYKWPKFEVKGASGEPDDEEVVLWACDAMFDRDFIRRHLGYAMGLPAKSSEVYKRVVNAAWNAVASGATPLLLRSLVASICGIPTVKEEGEKVERVYRFVDGPIQVVTDKNVYDFPKGTKLRKNVKTGAVLKRFDTMDKAIRVYACPSDVHRLPAYSDFLDDFDEFTADVPAIDLPPALFRTTVSRGFSVDWDLRDVVYCGDDANGNPRLRFSIGGSVEDEDAFWNGVWARYEASGKDMKDCLEGINYDKIYTVGAVWCQISPMEFFMRNLIGANTLIVTVRTDTLAEDAPLYDPKFFGVVKESIPAYIRLYVIEHSAVSPDKYSLSSVKDEADAYVGYELEDQVSFQKTGKRKKGAKSRDWADSKWVASCMDYDGFDDYE